MTLLPMTNSSINTDLNIEPTEQKPNARSVDQDDAQPAKRLKLDDADDIWEYALENPLDRYEPAIQNEALVMMINTLITSRQSEPQARLIIKFPPSVLILLFTYLDFQDIRALFCLCKFGNEDLKTTFLTQANTISNLLFQREFSATAKQSQAFTLKLLDASPDIIRDNEIITQGTAILDEIHDSLEGNEAMTMQEIRDIFDESYFAGDEIEFLKHVVRFNDPIYKKEHNSTAQRFAIYAKNLKKFMRYFEIDSANLPKHVRDANAEFAMKLCFFPLRLIQNPGVIRSLALIDIGIKTLPPQIKDCVNLKELKMRDIRCLPSEIGELTSLESLELHYHNVTTLPDSIINLTNLKKIDFEYDDADVDEPIPFDSLTDAQKDWLLTLRRNGCVIQKMTLPPEE